MDYLKRAEEIKNMMVDARRYIHQNAEVGLETKKAADYLEEKLTEMGYKPERIIENGLVATVASPAER